MIVAMESMEEYIRKGETVPDDASWENGVWTSLPPDYPLILQIHVCERKTSWQGNEDFWLTNGQDGKTFWCQTRKMVRVATCRRQDAMGLSSCSCRCRCWCCCCCVPSLKVMTYGWWGGGGRGISEKKGFLCLRRGIGWLRSVHENNSLLFLPWTETTSWYLFLRRLFDHAYFVCISLSRVIPTAMVVSDCCGSAVSSLLWNGLYRGACVSRVKTRKYDGIMEGVKSSTTLNVTLVLFRDAQVDHQALNSTNERRESVTSRGGD